MSSAVQGRPPAPGQWDHLDLFGPSLSALQPVTLGEGHTPLVAAPRLGASLGVPDLWLKREDVSPTGSHKARALALQCAALRGSGRPGAISSSGNAGVAAAAYARAAGVTLAVLVSPRTPRAKLRRLSAFAGPLMVTPTPLALLRRAVLVFGCEDLRPSVHPLAVAAYRGIAAELDHALAADRPAGAVFLYASSGATVVGLAEGFAAAAGGATPSLHIVQASATNELVRPWEPGLPPIGPSPIGDLGARRSRRAGAVRRAVTASGGRGWHVDAPRLAAVRSLAAAAGVATSWEGIAALAAIRDAAPGLTGQRVVALLTGAADQLDLEPDPDPGRLEGLTWVETAGDLDLCLRAAGLTPR